jgi:hypothetical protein
MASPSSTGLASAGTSGNNTYFKISVGPYLNQGLTTAALLNFKKFIFYMLQILYLPI